jgi:hypothetical protein
MAKKKHDDETDGPTGTTNPSDTSADGGPADGNRDDALEKSLGVRTPDMGESGASRKDGKTPAAKAKAAAPAAAGDGPVLWEGSIAGDLLHGTPTRFRGPANEAEAREAYRRHAGIRHTTGTVRLTRVEDSDEG